jgi:hypothetical protein
MSKKLSYKDFLVETLSDKPSKLYLSNADGVTDCCLDVLSASHPTLKRAIITYGLAEQEVYTEARKLDKIDLVLYVDEHLPQHRKELAEAMVTGGNFEGFIHVLENPVNVDAVVARAYDASNYAVKK